MTNQFKDERGMDEPRRSTGIAGLDEVLRGGIFHGSAFIISGAPGTGKTVLANQIAFHLASAGEPVLYMTLLAESHGRLLQHMRRMSFFDPGVVPSRLTYVGAFDVLDQDGLSGLTRLLHSEIERTHVAMVVLDGLFVAEDRADSIHAFRRFVHDVQGLAELKGCTILLLTNARRKGSAPEHTMVDGWIELHLERVGPRAMRQLEVHKYRGSGFIEGTHKLRIGDSGIELWPRLEAALPAPPLTDDYRRGRMATGIDKLDEMLGGGLRLGSTALVVGPTGSGKTTLGLHFLSRSTAEEPGVFLGFYENPQKLLDKAQRLGLLLDDAGRGRSIEFLWWPATEQYLDEIGHDLLATVRRTGARRVIIDGLAALRVFACDKERVPVFLTAVANELRARDASCIFTLEAGDPVGPEPPPIADLAAIAESIVMLDLQMRDGRLERTVSVLKARDSAFDPVLYGFTIGDHGISIGAPANAIGGRQGRPSVHRPNTRA